MPHRTRMILIVDPPSGWKYGFPRPLPEGKSLRELLHEQGYPVGMVNTALEHSRYWYMPEDEVFES